MKNLKPHQAAAREAWEEAGVEGRIRARKIGVFDYDKRLSGGQLQPVRVEVYPLEVVGILSIIPFPDAMCGVDPIAKGNLELVASCCEVVPEVEPLVPVLPRRDFAREHE
jgi:hypothetical protein